MSSVYTRQGPQFLTSVYSRQSTQLSLLTIACMAAVYAKMTLGPLQETLRAALGLTDNQISLLQGAALALPMLVISVPLGLAVDRFTRVRMLRGLIMLMVVGSVLTAAAPNFTMLFLARAVVGLAVFATMPVTGSLLADYFPPAQRGRAGIVLLIGQFAAMSAAFAVGGALVTTSEWGANAWRLSILWGIAPPLVIGALCMFLLREPQRTARLTENPTVRDSFVALWSCRAIVLPLMIGQLMAVISLQSLMVWAAPALARDFDLAPDHVGAIMAVLIPIGGIGGSIVGGFIADRTEITGGARKTLLTASAMALLCLPLSLFVVATDVTLASACLGGLVAVLTMVCVMGSTVLIVVIPNDIRGMCLGLLTGIGAVVSIGLAPLLVSWFAAALGGPALIGKSLAVVCASGSLLCALIFVLNRRSFSSRAALE